MIDKIEYGICPNPKPDEDGNTTYQVRHMPQGTMNEKAFLAHLKYHNTYNTTTMMASLVVLKFENLKNMNATFQYETLATREKIVDRVEDRAQLKNFLSSQITPSIGCGL